MALPHFYIKFNHFEANSAISNSNMRSHNVNRRMTNSQIHNLLHINIIFAHNTHEVYIGYAFGKLYLAQSRL